MSPSRTRGAYRKEDRAGLPTQLQRELVERAAMGAGSCKALAGLLDVPKSSVHYYMTGRLTIPVSLMERMLATVHDADLERRVRESSVLKDRTWANTHAAGVYREMCRGRVTLPTRDDLDGDDILRRKAAAIVSYVMAEGSIWIRRDKWDEGVVNITFAEHETDLYEHFATLCRDVFRYDIGPPQPPGNGARAIRGFIYSRFVAQWLIDNGIRVGEKSAGTMHLPEWIVGSRDSGTLAAAIQPWCDGEGTVSGPYPCLCVSQSRHADITEKEIPPEFVNPVHRTVTKRHLVQIVLRGQPGLDHCEQSCRSEILDDVLHLSRRLGLHPTLVPSHMVLKDNGYWSCVWLLRFGTGDSKRLVPMGLVTQSRKRRRLCRE
jgi:hypothetical protein